MAMEPIQQRPAYPVESVDNALRLIQLLQDGSSLRLADAAAELGVAMSTAHRLMAMLVYRGFALQDDQRRYVAGSAFSASRLHAPWVQVLKDVASEPMDEAAAVLGENVNLVIRVGVNVRFIHCVEGHALLRVVNRSGSVIQALATSAGKILLAHEPLERVERLYFRRTTGRTGQLVTPTRFAMIKDELEASRARGYAINRGESEPGFGAVGVVIRTPSRAPLAALTISVPVIRLAQVLEPSSLATLFYYRDRIDAMIAESEFGFN